MTVPTALAARLVERVLGNVRRRYPYQLVVAMNDDGDAQPPHALTPIFAGAYDWHSAVHSYWTLARLRAFAPERIDAALDGAFTDDAVAREVAFLARRPGFELPYGLAWVLKLSAELARPALAPLETVARERLLGWLGRLPVPVRSGEHAQSAFAACLALDWARATGDRAAADAITAAAERHHGDDVGLPLHLEPGGHDFLSATLGAAALIARVRGPGVAAWLDRAAPALGRTTTITPVSAADRADGKLVHWDGLNLSRAWMLAEIAGALPGDDERVARLTALAAAHGEAGVAALDDMSYAGAHWLPSFAVYWLTL